MNRQVIEIKEETRHVYCHFCQRSEVNSLEWGPLYKLAGMEMHYFCMLFSAGLSQNGKDDEGILGFMPIDIRRELKRGEKLKCKFCKLPRATIGCSVKNCKASYHFPCGLEKGHAFQFLGNYESYCPLHKETINIPLSPEEWECPICFLPVVQPEDSPLWPPCCQKNVFHKTCILKMAKHHGVHFFKCPLCNDRDQFTEAMGKAGVYVPDRDASWELANDFEDHNQVYSKCDAEECKCPKGRTHIQKSDTKPWKLVRCAGCAGAGMHRRCGNLLNLTWHCVMCAKVLCMPANQRSRIQRHHYDLSSDDEIDETSVVRLKDIITKAPEVVKENGPCEGATSIRSRIFGDVPRQRPVYVDESDTDEDAQNDNPDKMYTQRCPRLRQKMYDLKFKNAGIGERSTGPTSKLIGLRNFVGNKNGITNKILSQRGSSNNDDSYKTLLADEEFNRNRSSIFDAKLKHVREQCYRQSSTTTSSSHSTNDVSNNVPYYPPLLFQDFDPNKLINGDTRRRVQGHVLEPRPNVTCESTREVKISSQISNVLGVHNIIVRE